MLRKRVGLLVRVGNVLYYEEDCTLYIIRDIDGGEEGAEVGRSQFGTYIGDFGVVEIMQKSGQADH